MLYTKAGKEFDAKNLPRGRKAREAVLATLREVLQPKPARGGMFSLQSRARLVEARHVEAH